MVSLILKKQLFGDQCCSRRLIIIRNFLIKNKTQALRRHTSLMSVKIFTILFKLLDDILLSGSFNESFKSEVFTAIRYQRDFWLMKTDTFKLIENMNSKSL